MAAENSEVSPVVWLVAVGVTTCHASTAGVVVVKLALPLASVVTLFWPKSVFGTEAKRRPSHKTKYISYGDSICSYFVAPGE